MKVENDENFLKHITRIGKVLKIYQTQNLALEGKITTVFKALLMSKIAHLAFITNIPTSTMKEFNKYKKNLFGKTKIQK